MSLGPTVQIPGTLSILRLQPVGDLGRVAPYTFAHE